MSGVSRGDIVIMFGPPGAGKGTQAQLLHEKFGWEIFSTGSLFRNEIKMGTDFGKKIDKILQKGDLIDDEITMGFVRDYINGVSFNSESEMNSSGIILDGIPRTVTQSKMLDVILLECGFKSVYVIILDVGEDILVKRILSRVSCKDCASVYSIENNDACPSCGCSDFIRRDDDNESSVRRRVEVYSKNLYPIIEYYKYSNSVKFIQVSGDDSAFNINSFIISSLS